MSKLISGFLFLAAALFAAFPASAQSPGAGCPISVGSPSVQTGTSYTLSNADNCKVLVFSSGSAVTVSVPNAAAASPNGMPHGFRVFIKSIGAGGVTVGTPTTSTMDGASSPIAVTQGKGVWIWSDGTNYYSSGIGVAHP